MKCYAALTLALATLALASPMPKHHHNAGAASNTVDASVAGNNTATAASPNAQSVSAAIDAWLKDIKAVNTFVDTAANLTDPAAITAAATTALVAAQDEGVQNDALKSLANLDASGLAANADLVNQFNIIGPAIKDTIANPQNLQKNLAAINGARCPPPVGNGAIFEEGAVQQSAALAAGVKAALPELPAACGTLAKAAAAKAAPATR